MKIFKLLVLATLLIGISSCSPDNGNEPIIQNNTEEKLLGRWIVDEYDITGSVQIVLQDSGELETFEGCGKDLAYDLVFSANPNSFSSNGTYKLSLNTTDDIGTTNQLFDIDVDSSGSWSLSADGSKINIDDGVSPYQVSIVELTNNELRFIRNISETEVDGTSTISTSAVESFIFIRQ